ncbi:hypothetical protein CLTEP_09270 [Clostridium tepidiprofundi DSM 19306]|uniref:Uncharacterized protein n=1 Tax=Clostridium tepidiprofundi DSM 19306 TaxID=1121338 RepID=A0A151B638_9CLOT|nr:hypothetical protein CLTEP_09270 [Clostridium tepidiprofundi DSM 19306]
MLKKGTRNSKPYTIYFLLKAGLKFDEEVLKNLKNSDLSGLGFKKGNRINIIPIYKLIV